MFMNLTKSSEDSHHAPFSTHTAPTKTSQPPLTKCRMGFLIVFDATDASSFEAAMQINHALHEHAEISTHKVYLVANQIDKDPYSPTFQKCLKAAKHYAETHELTYMEVSALDYTRVRKLFRDAIEDICSEAAFAMTGAGGHAVGGGAAGDSKDCSVQ
eukprot:TRINITY_DN22670_c0_g1_i1.p1 TRINITY_DN22670_c0_g1~~TRINITY_DN22670_c0_g1_i1.p1  ORF type:complete len:158 (-),score=35.26 TRINITY_DN22670_c0_g1_i1:62-535(-)